MERSLKKLAAGVALAALVLCPARAELVQVIGPFGGLNNTDNPLIIPANEAQDLLNVDITPQGKSVKKRKGYGLQFNLAVTTSPVHGVYNFYDANGNDVSLFFHDRYGQGSVGGATPTTLFSTATVASTWQCVDALGFAYCGDSSREPIIKTNGVTAAPLSATAPAGTILATTPERLVIAGTGANPQRITFSKANDFTTWTAGGQPTDPTSFEIASPGSRISHVTYAFGRIIWFKDNSFGQIVGTDNTNWQVSIISPNLGTIDNTSVYWQGVLYFRGQDGHVYSFDGASIQKLTRDQSTTILASANRRSNSWSQTSQSDLQTGSIVPSNQLSFTISPSDVIVSSFAASETSSTQWGSGTASGLTVGASSITLTINNSGNIDNNSFENSGTWTTTGNSGPIVANQATGSWGTDCPSGPTACAGSKVLSCNMGTTTGASTAVQLLDTGNNVLATKAIDWSSKHCTCTTATLSSAGLVGRRVKVRVTATDGNGTNTATGNPFVIGGDMTFQYANATNSQGNCLIDNILAGSSTVTTGTFTSQTYNTGFTSATYQVPAFSYAANTTTPTFALQTSTSTTGTFSTIITSTGSNAVGNQYVKYVVTFPTVGSTENALSSVTGLSILARSTGTYYSAVKNAPSLTSWDTFGATKVDNGGTHTFYMRSSTNSFTVTSSTPSWTVTTNGSVISISTGTFFQVRDDFALTSATQTPTLNDFTVNWFEGTASDKAYGVYFDNAVWWSIASGAGATGNNYILRYDLLNSVWGLYDIGMNGMLVRNNGLYFGSATAGKIFKFGDVTNDNGSAINAYWKSKDFFGDSPFTTKEFRTISVSAAKVANSTMTVTYTVNGTTSTAYTVGLYDASSSFLKHNKNLPLATVGSYFNVMVSNNAIDQPFELFGVQYTFEPKPWMPTP